MSAGLLLLLASGAAGSLQVSLEGEAHQDGRSTVQARSTEAPAPLEGEDPDRPPLLLLDCEETISLPGDAILIPARLDSGSSTSCRASLRGVVTEFDLPLLPAGPGLHAAIDPLRGPPGTRFALSPFRVDDRGQATLLEFVRVGTSLGEVKRDAAGILRLQTPESRAPQILVLALAEAESVGAAFLPLPRQTRLPVRAKRRALVTVRIAGRDFGPVETANGLAEVQLEVPPGITEGTLRVTDRLGNARERPVELHTPPRPRLAAVASAGLIPVGERMRVAIAIADPVGRPSAAELPVRVTAFRGSIEGLRKIGPGLWSASYRAPETVGADEIRIGVEGDDAIGRAVLPLEVKAGEPATLTVGGLPASHPPGTRLSLALRVEDAVGNHLIEAPVEAVLLAPLPSASYAPAVESLPGELLLTLPERLPAGGVRLELRSGKARQILQLPMHPGPAVSATLETEIQGRSGQAQIAAVDRFGNPVGSEGYQVTLLGARLVPAASGDVGDPGGVPGVLRFEADEHALEGILSVHGPKGELCRTELRFRPATPWSLGATAHLTFASNLGSLNTGVPSLGLRLSHHRRRVEVALSLEAGLLVHRATLEAQTPAGPALVEQRLTALDLPLLLGLRIPLGPRTGAYARLGPTFLPTRQVLHADFQPEERRSSLQLGGRLELGVDRALGPGRLHATLGFGRARLDEGPVLGTIDGLRVSVGYLIWLDAAGRARDAFRD